MACMKLGTKEDGFRLEGQTWMCFPCIPSDIRIEVKGTFFRLHKFPLLSRSGFLEKLIQDFSARMKCEDEIEYTLHLDDLPGGAKSFLFIAKFCYDVKVELTARNVVSLRCAAEHLQMTASYGEGNLISHTENFLFKLFGSWDDTIKALETSEKFLPLAEELHIVSKGIDSLAMIACANTHLFSYSMAGKSMTQSLGSAFLRNGVHSTCDKFPSTEDGWYEDVAFFQLPLFKRLICAVHLKGMAPNKIAEMIIFYAKSHLPLNGRQLSFRQSTLGSMLPLSDVDQRTMIEEIVMLLPSERGVIPTKFLLKLLRISKILYTSPSSREALERKIGAELDQVLLEDLLIPNTCYSAETLYDVECIHRIVNHFILNNEDCSDFISNNLVEGVSLVGGSHSLEPMTKVANLLDNYLAEVAPDVNLGLEKFISLAAAIPEYSRPLDDGIYRAIDIYLKARPWLTDSEKEHLCRLMNYQKFSLEASTHAAHNERLPLRVIVQVLFFEQLHLRTSVASWLFVSDSSENSQNLSSGKVASRNDHMATTISENGQIFAFDDMKERVSELEKECESMKQDIGKLVKHKGSWNNFCRRFGLTSKIPCGGEALQPPNKSALNGKYKHEKCKFGPDH